MTTKLTQAPTHQDDDFAIRIHGLSKCYHIYNTPHDRLKQYILPKLQKLLWWRQPKQYYHDFWALQDISFEVKKGETVGIIGRNGSGKSTLLQLICGTLSPTVGDIEINGRIAALLELGSGFNAEFTGRENIYMNASILGLSEQEINEQFDNIVAFADIGEFIEQPVKTYSSGMFVRLAFAVIAHVNADILIIDEALSVGDAVFTQKCMRYLRKFMETGTILFVSHDNGAVVNLCQKAVWLNKGIVREIGEAKEVVKHYTHFTLQEIYGDTINLSLINDEIPEETLKPEQPQQPETTEIIEPETKITFFNQLNESSGWETGKAKITAVHLYNEQDENCLSFNGGEAVCLEISAVANDIIYSPIIGWFVKDRLGQALFGENTYTHVKTPLLMNHDDTIKARFKFNLPLLPNGEYTMTLCIAEGDPFNHTQHHWLHDALILKIASDKLRYGLVGIPFKEVTLALN